MSLSNPRKLVDSLCIKSCITSPRSNESKNKFERKQRSQHSQLGELQPWIFIIAARTETSHVWPCNTYSKQHKDTNCSIFMAGFKHGTLRKFVSKEGKGQQPTVNYKANKKPHIDEILYICSLYLEGVGGFITLRPAGKCYSPHSTNQ